MVYNGKSENKWMKTGGTLILGKSLGIRNPPVILWQVKSSIILPAQASSLRLACLGISRFHQFHRFHRWNSLQLLLKVATIETHTPLSFSKMYCPIICSRHDGGSNGRSLGAELSGENGAWKLRIAAAPAPPRAAVGARTRDFGPAAAQAPAAKGLLFIVLLDLDNMDKHGEKHGKNHETSESMACCFTCLHYAI